MINHERLLEEVRGRLQRGHRTWVKRRTLTRWAGVQRASGGALNEIEAVLVAAGFGLAPMPLRNVRPDETVRLSPRPIPARGLPILAERQLEKLLYDYWRFVDPLSELDLVRRQKRLAVGDTHIVLDLYGEDAGSVVAIELKLGSGGDRPGSQVRRYMEALEQREAARTRPRKVRGLVISAEENPSEERELREWAEAHGKAVEWRHFVYELHLKLPNPGAVGDP
jgi:hypothetical protein